MASETNGPLRVLGLDPGSRTTGWGCVAIEGSRSLIVLAQARGALLATLATREVVIEEYSPAEVKSAVTGNGRADKAQVAAMVTRLLRLTEIPRPADAADALALAICHVWRGGAASRLEAAVAAQAAAR